MIKFVDFINGSKFQWSFSFVAAWASLCSFLLGLKSDMILNLIVAFGFCSISLNAAVTALTSPKNLPHSPPAPDTPLDTP